MSEAGGKEAETVVQFWSRTTGRLRVSGILLETYLVGRQAFTITDFWELWKWKSEKRSFIQFESESQRRYLIEGKKVKVKSAPHSLKAWSLHPSLALLLSSPSSLPSFTGLPMEPGLASMSNSTEELGIFFLIFLQCLWTSHLLHVVFSTRWWPKYRQRRLWQKETISVVAFQIATKPSFKTGQKNLANINSLKFHFQCLSILDERKVPHTLRQPFVHIDAFAFTTSCNTKHLL